MEHDIFEWHLHFAFWPVPLNEGGYAWMRNVYRRRYGFGCAFYQVYDFEYTRALLRELDKPA